MTQRSVVVSVRWLAIAFALATFSLGTLAQMLDGHGESLAPSRAFAATETAIAATHPASKAHWESSRHETREACALCLLKLRNDLAALDCGAIAPPTASPDEAPCLAVGGLGRCDLSLAGSRAPPLA